MFRKNKNVVVATVWLVGFNLSLLRALKATVNNDTFNEFSLEHFSLLRMTEIVLFCTVPVIPVAVFSGLTAARIRGGARATETQTYRSLSRTDYTSGPLLIHLHAVLALQISRYSHILIHGRLAFIYDLTPLIISGM
jgi:hypothetical protein